MPTMYCARVMAGRFASVRTALVEVNPSSVESARVPSTSQMTASAAWNSTEGTARVDVDIAARGAGVRAWERRIDGTETVRPGGAPERGLVPEIAIEDTRAACMRGRERTPEPRDRNARDEMDDHGRDATNVTQFVF